MTRITKTEMNTELLQLRTLCANYAHVDKCNRREIMRLKSRIEELSAETTRLNIDINELDKHTLSGFNASKAPRAVNQVHSFTARAIEYCMVNKCNSVPPNVVAQWRAE